MMGEVSILTRLDVIPYILEKYRVTYNKHFMSAEVLIYNIGRKVVVTNQIKSVSKRPEEENVRCNMCSNYPTFDVCQMYDFYKGGVHKFVICGQCKSCVMGEYCFIYKLKKIDFPEFIKAEFRKKYDIDYDLKKGEAKYLYISPSNAKQLHLDESIFDNVPKGLMFEIGLPGFIKSLDLINNKPMLDADPQEIIKNLCNSGYYIQYELK